MLAKRITELREASGWTQVEMGKRLGVAKQTVSNWENDNIQPSIETLLRLSRLFGVTTDYLLGLDDVPRLNCEGLSVDTVAHLALLIEDYRAK